MSTVWEFVKRHKGKIVLGGAALVGGAVAVHQALSHGQPVEYQEEHSKLQNRRHYVFDTNQRSCDLSIVDLVPSIKTLVEARFNVDRLTEELHSNPNVSASEKLEQWNRIKIAAISRIVGLAYSYSLLTVALKAQISILAAEICSQFDRSHAKPVDWTSYLPSGISQFFSSSGSSSSMNGSTNIGGIDAASRQIFLQCIQYYTTKGVPQLLNIVEKIVLSEMESISLKQDMGKEEIRILIERIEKHLREGDHKHFSDLIAPFDESQAVPGDSLNGLLKKLIGSIQSKKCRETTSALVDYYVSAACGKVSTNPVPLAKQIPPLSDAFHTVSSTTFDSPLQNSLCSADVHQFAVEVFNTPNF